ncbi:hypothetical protein MKX01_033476 [Papaver californicum]|nr:hypothetical protein MKX01_033476 [Papaver californicum]
MADYRPKNILFTGAACFIASHVANRLIRNYPDYKIVVLDKLDYCSNLKNLLPSRADLVNFLLITESIDTSTYKHHVVLEACKVTGQIRRFIRVRTDEVYGETEENLLPTNPYSATKAGAKLLVMAYGKFPEKLIPKLILLAMKGKPLPIHGDGSNLGSYLYCEDVAEAFEVVLHKGEIGHVYNIGTKKKRRVIDVVKDVCQLFSLDPEAVIKFLENRPFNDQRYFLDDQKLKNLGLKKAMDWYLKNPEWRGVVSGALLPHPKMLMMPGTERVLLMDIEQMVNCDSEGGRNIKLSKWYLPLTIPNNEDKLLLAVETTKVGIRGICKTYNNV